MKAFSKEEFMQRYVLARAARVDGSPDIPSIIKAAELAWSEIQRRAAT